MRVLPPQINLLTVLGICLIKTACLAALPPAATSFHLTIEIVSPEPTLDISRCFTIICCSDCPEISIDRVINGDTFQSVNARIWLFGVDTAERGASRVLLKPLDGSENCLVTLPA